MSSPTPVEPVKSEAKLDLLRDKRVLVVDDAFDKVTVEDLGTASINAFLQGVGSQERLKGLVEALIERPLPATSEFNNELLNTLWENIFKNNVRPETEPLASLAALAEETLFADKLGKLDDVIPFCQHLSSLRFNVTHLGSKATLPAGGVGLVLMDYVLGPEQPVKGNPEAEAQTAASIKNSESHTKQLYRDAPSDSEAPFLVLMSSKEVTQPMRDDFRDATGLIGGLFDFVSKKEICDPSILEMKLRMWNYDLPARHQVQRFVNALSQAVKTSVDKFEQGLRALSLQDYAHLQSLALQQDGEPLGEYLMTLHAGYLGDLLQTQQGIRQAQEELDQVEFEHLLASQTAPSTQITRLYQNNVSSSKIGGLRPHPREDKEAANSGALPPYVHFGDVFVSSEASKPILMVLNAACDLAYAPHTPRTPDLDQAILMIPGRLIPFSSVPEKMQSFRTELFECNGSLFRIVWQMGHVKSYPLRSLEHDLHGEGYVLTSRLKAPWAMAVQQQFASQLTRVGLPVSPPMFITISAQTYCVGEDGNALSLTPPISEGIVVVHRKQENVYVREILLTQACVFAVQKHLDTMIAVQEAHADSFEANANSSTAVNKTQIRKQVTDAREKAGELRTFKLEYDFWHGLMSKPRKWTSGDKFKRELVFEKGKLHLYFGEKFDGPWANRPFLALNVDHPSLNLPVNLAGQPLPEIVSPSLSATHE